MPLIVVPDNWRYLVCGFGNGPRTCSYLGLHPTGFVCMKNAEMRATVDERRDAGTMRAMGDHCDGTPWEVAPEPGS